MTRGLKIFCLGLAALVLFGSGLPAEKTDKVKGVYISQSGTSRPVQKVSGSFYSSAAPAAASIPFVDLQVLEPMDKLVVYKNRVYVKGLVSPNINNVIVAGTPVKIMDQGQFYSSVEINTTGKHLMEIVGRTGFQEMVIKKRILYMASFSDVPNSQWAADEIENLATLGYLKGFKENLFNPEGFLTRAEMAVILARINNIDLTRAVADQFSDIPDNYWAAAEIKAVTAAGLMASPARKVFNPERTLTRADFFDSIRRLEGLNEGAGLKQAPFSDVPVTNWVAGSLEALKKAGWFHNTVLSSQAQFHPEAPVARKELAFWLSRVTLVAQKIKWLLDWEQGFGPAESLKVEELAPTEIAAKNSGLESGQKPVNLSEIRPQAQPPRPEKIVAVPPPTYDSESVRSSSIITIAPQKQLIPGVAGKTVSFDLNDAAMADVIKIFSQEMGINIIAAGEITGKVSVSFNKVPVQDAFETVLKFGNYTFVVQGDIILVYPTDKTKGLIGRQTVVHIYNISYADMTEIQEKINKVISSFGETNIDKRLKLLIVRDLPENLEQIDQMVAALDAPPRQVLVQAMILDINLTKSRTLGIKWLTDQPSSDYEWMGTGNTTSPLTTDSQGFYVHILKQGFQAFIQAVEKTGNNNYDLLASPTIIALNHEKASIFAGDSQAYASSTTTVRTDTGDKTIDTISFFDTGISLEFTPHITENGFIVMDINPEVSEGVIVKEKYPQKSTTKTHTQVMVKDGQTILIGGLIRDKNILTESGVPIIGNLPILGMFFKSKTAEKQKRELMILLTPHIINDKMLEQIARDKQKMEGQRQDRQRELDIIQ